LHLKSKICEVELKKPKIEEAEVWRSRRLKKSKIWRSRRLKKSKIYEVEDWRSQRFEVLRLNPSLRLELSLRGYWHGYALRVSTD
jgi:hypothetical protein